MSEAPTKRFSDRVSFYVRSRPSYPRVVLTYLRDELGLRPDHRVADVGSGTGILADLLMSNGNTVYGVEPNREMREAAEQLLARQTNFHSVDGSAEQTTLPDASVEFVTAAQAFHWFRPDETRREFRRILVPRGFVVLLWNQRRNEDTPFSVAYQRLIDTFSIDRPTAAKASGKLAVDPATLDAFFGRGNYRSERFDNHQDLNLQGLEDRALSSSYLPSPDHPRCQEMLDALRSLHAEYASAGVVRIDYDTLVFAGRLD